MDKRLEACFSGILTTCAVIIALSVARQQFTSGAAFESADRFEAVDGWEELLAAGRRVGSASAPVQIVEFADLQCPFCRTLHEALGELLAEHPDDIAIVYVHFPLEGLHPNAEPAARAAECGAAQGRFSEVLDVLYDSQEELGLRAWSDLASSAGIADLLAFDACMDDEQTAATIRGQVDLGARHGVMATPTLMINGWELTPAPHPRIVAQHVRDILAGSPPFPAG